MKGKLVLLIRASIFAYLPLIAVILFISSCSPLSKTQMVSLNQYNLSVGQFSEYAKQSQELIEEYQHRKYAWKSLQLVDDSAFVKHVLTMLPSTFSVDLTDSSEIEQYISSYMLINPEGYEYLEVLGDRVSDLSIIPFSSQIGSLIDYSGSSFKDNQFRKKAYLHFNKQSESLINSLGHLGKLFERRSYLLTEEKEELKSDYQAISAKIDQKDLRTHYLFNTLLINESRRLNAFILINQYLIDSLEFIKHANRRLKEELESKKRLQSNLKEVQDLQRNNNMIEDLINKL